MPHPRTQAGSLVDRMARVAFLFFVMNYSAVAGMISAFRGRDVWQ
ncbi:MAG TPA: hypothetical protein VGH34_06090 [Vicinamibacterales bacterium]